MKRKISESILLTLLFGLTVTVPALGDKSPSGRELTILYSKRCAELTASMQKKIEALQEEIAGGRRIYTPAEVKKLQAMLKETEELMDAMMYRYGDEAAGGATGNGSTNFQKEQSVR